MKKLSVFIYLILLLLGCSPKTEIKEAKAIPEFEYVQFREDNSTILEINLTQYIGGDYYVNYVLPISMNETKTQITTDAPNGYIYIRHYQGNQVLASSMDNASSIHTTTELVKNKENQVKMNFDVYFEYENTILNYDGFIILSLDFTDTYVEANIVDTHFNNKNKS